MSNLNVNNIDVQRIINVLDELQNKMEICSFLTFKTMEKVEARKEEITQAINDEEFMKDIDNQFMLMMEFSNSNLKEKKEVKEEKHSEIREDDFIDLDEGQNQPLEISIMKENLKDIDENKPSTKELAKHTRHICRKYYKDKNLINFMCNIRGDVDISKFCDEFIYILFHNIKKVKMTLEEEKSNLALNKHLTAKIIDLENQINEKQNKYEKLKKDRQEFKTNCINKLEDIEKEIEMIRGSTDQELKQLETKVNTDLNKVADSSTKKTQQLKDQLNQVIVDLEKKKGDNDLEEKKYINDNYINIENILRNFINVDYDDAMQDHTEKMDKFTKDDNLERVQMANMKGMRDKTKERLETYEESFKKHQDRLKQLNYENEVKIKASEWIQGQFRGYWTRKTLRKKYKFLAILKKPKIEPPTTDKKGGKPKPKPR